LQLATNNDIADLFCKYAEGVKLLDWNDLRHFLAVARTGSTLAAGRALRVSQTTAARRVAALEAELGLVLFERRPGGYRLTPAGEALVPKAEAVEAEAGRFGDAAAAQSRDASGTVRVTVEEIFAVTILTPILRDLHEAHPGIRIELDTSEDNRDLAGGEADIALRSADQPTGGGLVGRRLATFTWALYCSRAYASAHGRPRTRKALRGHDLIGGGGPGVWRAYRAWLERNDLVDLVAIQQSTTSGLLAAVRAGSGLAVLPTLVADMDEDLLQCLPPKPDYEMGFWLLTHERLRHTPRVRVVMDFLAERLIRLERERQQRAAEDLEPVREPAS
jgi:DNA-binding transcriptional LysR family regulator